MRAAERLDYEDVLVPKDYVCTDCEVTGVKLWRAYQTFDIPPSLLCLRCACKAEGEARYPTEDGKSLYTGLTNAWYRTADMPPYVWHGIKIGGFLELFGPTTAPGLQFRIELERTDQIGGRVPAVPTEECDGYWGYTSVPEAGCSWWNRLPYFEEAKA